ncbi:helix-turn-helix domain-containing protein [Shewanella sp. Isolate7]|uniref:helix-turn-helix domain-containing protein n=1 Tax=Shewanella sp. Isolate7 TaxID=2908528 RepID=UPI001EFC8EEE|nr:helix-turn-helix domain-containing protein [Shewanella sp. Isolate7]MCG9722679.1 helix-turn-helix domain-containing protein [Shewanella sp. Isolate7]
MSYQPPKVRNTNTLVKAEAIFQLVAEQGDLGNTLKQLQKQSGQPRTTVHRALMSFTTMNWLEQVALDDRSVCWRVSPTLLRLAFNFRRRALGGNTLNDQMVIDGVTAMNAIEIERSKDVTIKALRVFQLVSSGSLTGKTLDELQYQSGYARTTTYRLLCTWERLGWLKSVEVDGRSERWCMSEKLLALAHQYQNQRLQMIHQIKEKYQSVAGEQL